MEQERVLGKIALSLSGGGYRAAAFHLGVLEMLDELRLLPDVKMLSTVSGGSITGAFFALTSGGEGGFGKFRSDLYSFLSSTNVVSNALRDIEETRSVAGASAMPSLIRAAATVYDGEELLSGATFGDLEKCKGRFEDIVINTTEFRGGGSFRFVVSTNRDVCGGNNFAEIDEDVASKIRLADAVAASSCFPSGFEPIRFPGDFVWPKADTIDSIRADLGKVFASDIALMDGGIFDNQGIDSIRNIAARKNADIGLFIISDTSARNAEPFGFPAEARSGVMPLWLWRILGVILLAVSVLSMIAIGLEASQDGPGLLTLRGLLLYVLPFLFAFAVFSLLVYGVYKLYKLSKFVKKKTGFFLWKCIMNLTLPEIVSLSSSRLDSVIEMSTNVFMKRVRSMGFDSVFADLGIRNKLVPCLIYDIDNEARWGDEIEKNKLQPKDAIRKRVERAESYETNLWFLDKADLDNLIDCGRATICFKVIKYLLRYKAAQIQNSTDPLSKLYQDALANWAKLNN